MNNSVVALKNDASQPFDGLKTDAEAEAEAEAAAKSQLK